MNEVKNNTSNTKKQFYKKWWFYLIVLVVIIALFSQGEENIDISKNNDIEQEQSSAKQTEEESTNAEFDKKIYEFDDTIDSFLKKYNEIYSDKITSEMVSKYYHHGREHDDQIKVLNDEMPSLNIHLIENDLFININGLLEKEIVLKTFKERFNLDVELGIKEITEEVIEEEEIEEVKDSHYTYSRMNISDEEVNRVFNNTFNPIYITGNVALFFSYIDFNIFLNNLYPFLR